MTLPLDHFIYAGRDLDSMRASFELRTGVPMVQGGRHPGLGTHNALASLGTGVYFEVLAVDPTQVENLEGTMGGRINALPAPTLLAYLLKGQDLEQKKIVLASAGIGSDLFDASRTTPDGHALKWRLLVPHSNPLGDFVPKFIDWLDTPHPSTTSSSGCTLKTFKMGHPEAIRLRSLLEKLGADISVEISERPYMSLIISTPNGDVGFDG